MTGKHPPSLATWLADHLISGARRDALLGDLLEGYAARPSSAWYWRQVLLAIVASALHDIVDDKLLALRALLVGWAVYFLCAEVVIWAFPTFRSWVALWIADPFWSDQMASHVLVYVACAINGWLVAQLHRRRALVMVSLFALSVFLVDYGMMVWMFARYPIPPTVQRGFHMMVPPLLTIGQPVSVIAGGLWATRSSRVRALQLPAY